LKEEEKDIAQSEKSDNPLENKRPVIEDDEIDLVEVAKTIWAGRMLILKVTAVFIVLGLVIAFGSKVEYEASAKLLPESQEGMKPNLGGLGGLAGLAGVNLDIGGQSALTPDLYPQLVQSLPYQLNIIHQDIHFEQIDSTVSAYQYFKELDRPSLLSGVAEYTIGLPGKIKGMFSEELQGERVEVPTGEIIRLSKEDSELIENFKERININVDDQTGMITLTSEMPDPRAAAELANNSIKLLQERIISYKISKVQQNLEFVRERYAEALREFEVAQEKLARFNDRNRNVVTAMAQTEQQRLQNEYNVAFEVYKGLANQLEQAEIKVKEETPVFTVVEPVKVPVEKSKPRRILILIISIALGVFASLVLLLLNNFLPIFKDNVR